jgi:hypothetical protein
VPAPVPPPTGGSVLIGCDQAAVRVTVTAPSHLDPSCTYTGGFVLAASGAGLDCQGALVDGAGQGGRGIEISSPAAIAMADVTVRNCRIQGFLNGIRITRPGFRDLAPGQEYGTALHDVTVEDSDVRATRGVGVFVDAYTERTTLRRLHVEGAGSTGVYLEAGSRDNVVEDSDLLANGYRENGPDGELVTIGGLPVRFWGTGREGLAIDGSRGNRVVGNRFAGNAAGGVFLYENCGEYATERPQAWWERRYGADQNLIEANVFDGGPEGVWIGSRMAQNTYPMDCSDSAYVDEPLRQIRLDRAVDNVVRANRFTDVTHAVRVEDDGAVVETNTVVGTSADQWAVLVGTTERTGVLGRPVARTVVRANSASIPGNPSPYRWHSGLDGLTDEVNTADGSVVALCEVAAPPTTPFIFVLAFAIEPAGSPPTPTPSLVRPALGAQPACPAAPIPTPGPPPAGAVTPAAVVPGTVVTPAFTG